MSENAKSKRNLAQDSESGYCTLKEDCLHHQICNFVKIQQINLWVLNETDRSVILCQLYHVQQLRWCFSQKTPRYQKSKISLELLNFESKIIQITPKITQFFWVVYSLPSTKWNSHSSVCILLFHNFHNRPCFAKWCSNISKVLWKTWHFSASTYVIFETPWWYLKDLKQVLRAG